MVFALRCHVCGLKAGEFDSYDAWEDAARVLGWLIGEETVLCAMCWGRALQV